MRTERGVISPAGSFEHLAVGVQDEVVFELAADFGVAAGGGDGEFVGGAGVELDVEIHGEGGSVEGWAEIGGSGGEREAERSVSSLGSWRACSIPFRILGPEAVPSSELRSA